MGQTSAQRQPKLHDRRVRRESTGAAGCVTRLTLGYLPPGRSGLVAQAARDWDEPGGHLGRGYLSLGQCRGRWLSAGAYRTLNPGLPRYAG